MDLLECGVTIAKVTNGYVVEMRYVAASNGRELVNRAICITREAAIAHAVSFMHGCESALVAVSAYDQMGLRRDDEEA